MATRVKRALLDSHKRQGIWIEYFHCCLRIWIWQLKKDKRQWSKQVIIWKLIKSQVYPARTLKANVNWIPPNAICKSKFGYGKRTNDAETLKWWCQIWQKAKYFLAALLSVTNVLIIQKPQNLPKRLFLSKSHQKHLDLIQVQNYIGSS